VIDSAEVVAILARDDGKLVVRMPRVRVQFCSKPVVALCGPPIALFVLLRDDGFAVTGQVTKVYERLVAGY
jgi:hypothetical protein